MRLIDADKLYERLKADEELARDRVVDTPNSFPNGQINPSAIRYMAQLNERTRFKEIVYDAPTIEVPERRTGKWIDKGGYLECSRCGGLAPSEEFADGTLWKESSFCPDCGADMRGEQDG